MEAFSTSVNSNGKLIFNGLIKEWEIIGLTVYLFSNKKEIIKLEDIIFKFNYK
jgi:hypothetical protein